jgi:hypothetical protein
MLTYQYEITLYSWMSGREEHWLSLGRFQQEKNVEDKK